MNLLTSLKDSPEEKARIRVVYLLLGTVFFMPLQLYIAEGLLALTVIFSLYFIYRYGIHEYKPGPLAVPIAIFTGATLISLAGSTQAFWNTAYQNGRGAPFNSTHSVGFGIFCGRLRCISICTYVGSR